MASSLKLMLERAISSNRQSSALELPLDRKLGDLSRYTYVYADALPLRLERRISDQPAPNALHLAMSQPLGTLAPVLYVTSNALPLPLSALIADQPSASALPLGLARKLGTLTSSYVPPDDGDTDPVDPPPPIEYAPAIGGVASYISSRTDAIRSISNHRAWRHDSVSVASDNSVTRSSVMTVAQDYALKLSQFIPLSNWQEVLTGITYQLSTCRRISYIPFVPLFNESQAHISAAVGYTRCVKAHSAAVIAYRHCRTLPLQPAINYAAIAGHTLHGVGIDDCQSTKVQHAVPVPDRYYPIPEPPPVKPDNVCRIRPPSSQLPLRMARQRGALLSSHLPLTITCWHDDPPPIIPNLRSYIVHNVISATIGGIAVDLLSFNSKTDMDSYCWQGTIAITAKDYAKIKHKLDVPRGTEPMVYVTINGRPFGFIAEQQQRSRQFAQHTHTISGRSITARLGADYAVSQGNLIDQASYVSQIVAQQLSGLPVSVLDWDINDWLVPAGAYSTAGKTPIAVISDIASAGGGFVVSDPSQATLSVKPRWKVAAWQLSSATPDVTVPLGVIKQISDTKRVNPRYNTVLLTSASEGGEVYRQTQARDADAPTHDHALYTDRDAIVPAGTAILSDSGTHGDYTIKLRWADKYNLPLAEMGDIWQVNDTDGAWRAIVTGVSVDVDIDNDVPMVWQSVTVDRYLDV